MKNLSQLVFLQQIAKLLRNCIIISASEKFLIFFRIIIIK